MVCPFLTESSESLREGILDPAESRGRFVQTFSTGANIAGKQEHETQILASESRIRTGAIQTVVATNRMGPC